MGIQMKVKTYRAVKILVVLYMILALSLTKVLPLGNLSEDRGIRLIMISLVFILIFLCLYYSLSYTKYILNLNLYILFMYIVEMIYTCVKYKNSFSAFFNSNLRFLYTFMAGVIFYLLHSKAWTLQHLVNMILILTTASFILRIFISMFYNTTGHLLFSSIALESAAENWVRNNTLRINPPCFSPIYVSLALWMLFINRKRKTLYLACILLSFFYTMQIHQSRSLLVYQIVTTVITIIVFSKTSFKKMIVIVLLCIAAIIVVNTASFESFLQSFNIQNTSSGGNNTISRLYNINYFYNWWKKDMLLGIGGISESDLSSGLVMGHISDIGFLANIFRFGLLGFGLLLMIFGRWFWISAKLLSVRREDAALAVSIAISMLMININIDMYFWIFMYSIPFTVGIMEYLYMRNCSHPKSFVRVRFK